MTSTEEVCKAFFNLEHELNKGHGIISSIYNLVRRTECRDEVYFRSINDRIQRASIECTTIENYEQLLKTSFSTVDSLTQKMCHPKWVRIARIFYVTKTVEAIARRQLPRLTYLSFKDVAEITLCNHINCKFPNSLTGRQWDIMHVSERANQIRAKPIAFNTMVSLFAVCYAIIDIYNKI